MNEETNRFLTEGLKIYPDAKATVASFEDEISRQLARAAERRKEWLPLKDHRAKKPEFGLDDAGYWGSLVIEGTSPRGEGLDIDCGIWWDALPEVEQPIVYASLYEKPPKLKLFEWNDDNTGIKSFERWQRTFLYLPLSDPADIEELLNRLLDELLKKLV